MMVILGKRFVTRVQLRQTSFVWRSLNNFSSSLNLSTRDDQTWAPFFITDLSSLSPTRFSTSIGCVGSRLRARHRTRTRIVRVFAFLTSVDISLLESEISHCIVVVLVDLVAILALDRRCSATMFGVFLHCTAVLSDHMGHPQSSLSGTGVLWVSTGTHRCVDPPRQGGGSTMRQPSGCCSDAALH